MACVLFISAFHGPNAGPLQVAAKKEFQSTWLRKDTRLSFTLTLGKNDLLTSIHFVFPTSVLVTVMKIASNMRKASHFYYLLLILSLGNFSN